MRQISVRLVLMCLRKRVRVPFSYIWNPASLLTTTAALGAATILIQYGVTKHSHHFYEFKK